MPPHRLRRRAVLAGAAGGMVATSGCLGRVRNLVGRQRAQQISLSIATLPIDNDPYALRIANGLADNLEAAGVDVGIDPMDPEVLLREILINHQFDIYIAPYPKRADPGLLRSLLHSAYGEEGGWQNPFGFSSLEVNDLLEQQQRSDGITRQEIIHELQGMIVREQPFTVVAFPDLIAALRSDRFTGWSSGGLERPLSYLALESVDDVDTLQLLIRDTRITNNLNPIAAEYRGRADATKLLYEPLTRGPNQDIPWLAESIEWSSGETLSATVTLRETPWHDGEPLTAEDVAFTYRFLADTSLGEMETPIPTPWGRDRISLVESVNADDDRTVSFEFATNSSSVAQRAFAVPILPQHVWREQTDPANIAGIDIVGGTTEALVWPNEEPIGSGPLQFTDADADTSLELERFEDHFLNRNSESDDVQESGGNPSQELEKIPLRYHGGPSFERVVFQVVPSHDAAISVLEEDNADATIGGLRAGVVPRIGRARDLELSIARSDSFYHIGYNCRRAPLVDPQFRRSVARLVDRETIVSEVFEGYAAAAESPLDGTEWLAPTLRWEGESQLLPFAGDRGELDIESARESFRQAGYTYDGDRLVSRGEA